MKEVILNNGTKIPSIGVSVFRVEDANIAYETVKTALSVGYRHVDTAMIYGNEEAVGKAIRDSGIPREEIFLTTKLWNDDQRSGKVEEAIEASLKRLGMDYVNLYLVHWPVKETYVSVWKKMEAVYKSGKAKAIGVSNFLLHHLENLIQNCEIMPMADQIEFHPGFTQEATVRYCQEKGIYVQAWSPLGRKRVLEHPLLGGLAEKYNKSAAQICLRYEIQRQVIPLPKASTKERMVQNYQVFDFEIEKEDMYRIDSMQPAGWSGEHPDFPRVK